MSNCTGKCQKKIGGKCRGGVGCPQEEKSKNWIVDSIHFISAFNRVHKKCVQLDQLYINAGKEPVFDKQFRKAICPLHPWRRNLKTTEDIERLVIDPALLITKVAKLKGL